MSAAKTTRWLDLIAFLLHHHFAVAREDIFARVPGYLDDPDEANETARESARRKFERDKDELRALGIEIETVRLPEQGNDEAATGYRLRPAEFYLPFLELSGGPRSRPAYRGLYQLRVSPEDLALLDRATALVAQRTESPLAASAASARRKLEFDLPLPDHAIERILAQPLSDDGSRSLTVLQRAVADRTAVRCRYYSIGRDQEEDRTIEPYGLFFTWSRWYCVARDRDRDALRVFRVDRMREAVAGKTRQDRFEVPESFSIRDYLGRAPWELSGAEATQVRVRFAFPESRWVLARELGEAIEAVTEDGGAVILFQVQDQAPFLRWLLTFRGHARIESPEDWARALDALRSRVARLYGAKGEAAR